MKILKTAVKREKQKESGWFATDYLLDAPIDRAFILSLRPLGSFVYLDMLKEPFFKIENDYYMIKGVQGKDYFRIAVYGSMRMMRAVVVRILGPGQKRISYCLLRVPVHGMNNNISCCCIACRNTSLLHCAHEIITGGRV